MKLMNVQIVFLQFLPTASWELEHSACDDAFSGSHNSQESHVLYLLAYPVHIPPFFTSRQYVDVKNGWHRVSNDNVSSLDNKSCYKYLKCPSVIKAEVLDTLRYIVFLLETFYQCFQSC